MNVEVVSEKFRNLDKVYEEQPEPKTPIDFLLQLVSVNKGNPTLAPIDILRSRIGKMEGTQEDKEYALTKVNQVEKVITNYYGWDTVNPLEEDFHVGFSKPSNLLAVAANSLTQSDSAEIKVRIDRNFFKDLVVPNSFQYEPKLVHVKENKMYSGETDAPKGALDYVIEADTYFNPIQRDLNVVRMDRYTQHTQTLLKSLPKDSVDKEALAHLFKEYKDLDGLTIVSSKVTQIKGGDKVYFNSGGIKFQRKLNNLTKINKGYIMSVDDYLKHPITGEYEQLHIIIGDDEMKHANPNPVLNELEKQNEAAFMEDGQAAVSGAGFVSPLQYMRLMETIPAYKKTKLDLEFELTAYLAAYPLERGPLQFKGEKEDLEEFYRALVLLNRMTDRHDLTQSTEVAVQKMNQNYKYDADADENTLEYQVEVVSVLLAGDADYQDYVDGKINLYDLATKTFGYTAIKNLQDKNIDLTQVDLGSVTLEEIKNHKFDLVLVKEISRCASFIIGGAIGDMPSVLSGSQEDAVYKVIRNIL